MPSTAGRPVTGQGTAQSAECHDPSIEPCPPCCPIGFDLRPDLLAASVAVVRPPSFFAEPVNGGAVKTGTSSTTMVLAVGAVIAAGGVAWFLFRGKGRRRRR